MPTSKDDDPEEFFEHVLLNIDKEKRPRQLWEISVITNESKKPETVWETVKQAKRMKKLQTESPRSVAAVTATEPKSAAQARHS